MEHKQIKSEEINISGTTSLPDVVGGRIHFDNGSDDLLYIIDDNDGSYGNVSISDLGEYMNNVEVAGQLSLNGQPIEEVIEEAIEQFLDNKIDNKINEITDERFNSRLNEQLKHFIAEIQETINDKKDYVEEKQEDLFNWNQF